MSVIPYIPSFHGTRQAPYTVGGPVTVAPGTGAGVYTGLAPVVSTGGAFLVNKPAWANVRTMDFTQAVPPNPDTDRPIDATWGFIYDINLGGVSNVTQVSDPTAPMSGPSTWQVKYPAGTYSTGWSAGNIYLRDAVGAPSGFYTSIVFKVDSNYIWHPISNKFLWIVKDQTLLQLNEDGKWLHGEILDAGQWLDPGGTLNGAVLVTYNNIAVTAGAWHEIEWYCDFSGQVMKAWLDGVLCLHATGLKWTAAGVSGFQLDAHRGGGGETLIRDVYMNYDHLLISWP